MPRDRPCLHQCNRRGCAPTKCLGRIEYDRDDPHYWIGRGLEPVPGKPFGWAHNMERRALREHLERRGRHSALALPFAVVRMQERLHREKPTMRQRQAARPIVTAAERPAFTRDELQHLADLFAGANDPTSASIGAKAAAMLE